MRLIKTDWIVPGMVIADVVRDGRDVHVSRTRITVKKVERNACTSRGIHVNDSMCYESGAEVWCA